MKRVHVNGNVTVELREGVTERLNIRRVEPYITPSGNAENRGEECHA